jgi:hypothetical protein
MSAPHQDRVRAITEQFDHAMNRFLKRLEEAGPGGEVTRGEERWSAAQIAWHVALVNEAFAGLIAGTIKGPAPARPGFAERRWSSIVDALPARLDASPRVHPPGAARLPESIAKLRASGESLRAALAALTPERAGYTLDSPIVGEISVYQIGEWATAHVIRHNAQTKRVLGR